LKWAGATCRNKGVATSPSYMTSPPGRTCKRL
jgi:hypothetical protein